MYCDMLKIKDGAAIVEKLNLTFTHLTEFRNIANSMRRFATLKLGSSHKSCRISTESFPTCSFWPRGRTKFEIRKTPACDGKIREPRTNGRL